MNQNIYRKEALARLASPEQLDQLMPLTNPRGWIALATCALLLLVALAWLIFGSISVNVEGTGVLLRPAGLHQVVAPETGTVSSIAVHPGDEVQPMQGLLNITLASAEEQPRVVASSISGRVLRVAVQQGDDLVKGMTLATIESLDQPLEAAVYLPAADGYRVERGMEVQIRPVASGSSSSAILGRVRSAARYPASRSQMLRILASEELVSAVTRSGPRLEVVIELLPGAEKSLSNLFSGTPCNAVITLHRHSPIHLVLPSPEKTGDN